MPLRLCPITNLQKPVQLVDHVLLAHFSHSVMAVVKVILCSIKQPLAINSWPSSVRVVSFK